VEDEVEELGGEDNFGSTARINLIMLKKHFDKE